MSDLHWLSDGGVEFPPPDHALSEPNGLLAVGGDLSPERLLEAYTRGIFPWYEASQPILWWSPNPRAVLFPKQVHISKSLRKTLRRRTFQVTVDRCFRDIMIHCATTARRGQDGTWITPEMLEAYCEMHRLGYAHSIEVWHQQQLVGGLYGLAIGRVFFGESMFSTMTDASKTALVYLCRQLDDWGFAVIDCQVSNPHLLSLGAEEIDRAVFSRLLSEYTGQVNEQCWPGDWSNRFAF